MRNAKLPGVRRAHGLLWFLGAVLLLVLAQRAGALPTGAATRAAATGRFSVDRLSGEQLPNRHGVAIVAVDCVGRPGDRPCVGTIRLLPRSKATVRLLGSGPIASTAVRIPAAHEQEVRLALNQLGHHDLATNSLDVRIQLIQRGKHAATRPAVITLERAVVGHSRPTDVVTRHAPQAALLAAADTVKVYTWKWDIPVRSFLVLPEFRCPSEAPNVATNGTEILTRKESVRVGLVGKLDAQAKTGTGYAGFDVPHIEPHPGVRGSYPDYEVMTGWPKGGWTSNSVWAPVAFEDGHFELKVTCTSSSDRNEIAYVNQKVVRSFMFPWDKP